MQDDETIRVAFSKSSYQVSIASAPGRGCSPVSTLIPGKTPLAFRRSTKGVPLEWLWNRVSSYKIAPEIYLPSPGAEKRRPERVEYRKLRTLINHSSLHLYATLSNSKNVYLCMSVCSPQYFQFQWIAGVCQLSLLTHRRRECLCLWCRNWRYHKTYIQERRCWWSRTSYWPGAAIAAAVLASSSL